MDIAKMILEQLGGNRFITMTGSKNFIADGNTLRMNLAKNDSGANMLYITLTDDDLYTMRFIKYTKGSLNKKTFQWRDDKIQEIALYEGIFWDMLRKNFTQVTGMDTAL